jgi:hypothetical protein
MNVSVSIGWNLIGHSSNKSINVSTLRFTNSSGSNFSWQGAVSNQKVQAYLLYYEGSTNKYAATADLGMDSYAMQPNVGYWAVFNESGILTIPGAGGSVSGQAFNWSNLRFIYSGQEKNVTDAKDAGWVLNIADIKYYSSSSWNEVCIGGGCESSDVFPWRGYYIWSNVTGIVMTVRS